VIVVLLGPPGAGKGTQAKRMGSATGFKHVSTGDLLREAVEDGTELGIRAVEYMDAGSLVPDDVMLGLISELLDRKRQGTGVILDGFPRTVPQAEGLDQLLEDRGEIIDRVIFLDIGEEDAVERLSSRVSCPNCGSVHNLTTDLPKVDGLCDTCGGPLVRRPDDEPEKIEHRFEQFQRETRPTIEYYRSEGRLETVDAGRPIEEVQKAIEMVFNRNSGPQAAR
jgi:adenylate kinase